MTKILNKRQLLAPALLMCVFAIGLLYLFGHLASVTTTSEESVASDTAEVTVEPVAVQTENIVLSPIAQVAASQIGYVPAVENETKYHQDLGIPMGTDWCGYFIQWCLIQSGREDLMADLPGWAESWSEGDNVHLFGDGYTPKSGDIVTFDRDGNGEIDHCGIVEKYMDGTLYTVEGNTYPNGDESQALGVYERVYPGSGWMTIKES